MLKNINPLLNPDVLHAIAAMGHGDTLVVCDANFPALSVAKKSSLGKLLRIDGATVPQVTEAVLSLMPLDTFIENAALCMAVVDSPDEIPEIRTEVQAIIDSAETTRFTLSPVERFEFYEQASQSFAVITCGERRFYGCFIFSKGVVAPDT